jgi:hypothetical protein
MTEQKDEKKQDVLDRYEIVAIAVPGAALVAVIWYVVGAPGGGGIANISVGSLGAFTIASFVAGHVVQSIANVFEDAWARVTKAPAMIPLNRVPLARAWIEDGLGKLGVGPKAEPAQNTEHLPGDKACACIDCSLRGTRGKELRRIILSEIRAAKRSRMLDNLKITVAVSRGLCVVSFIAMVLVVVLWKPQDIAIERVILGAAIAVTIISFARAWRYTAQFEREIWIQFGELSRAKSDA